MYIYICLYTYTYVRIFLCQHVFWISVYIVNSIQYTCLQLYFKIGICYFEVSNRTQIGDTVKCSHSVCVERSASCLDRRRLKDKRKNMFLVWTWWILWIGALSSKKMFVPEAEFLINIVSPSWWTFAREMNSSGCIWSFFLASPARRIVGKMGHSLNIHIHMQKDLKGSAPPTYNGYVFLYIQIYIYIHIYIYVKPPTRLIYIYISLSHT